MNDLFSYNQKNTTSNSTVSSSLPSSGTLVQPIQTPNAQPVVASPTVPVPNRVSSDVVTYNAPQNNVITAPYNTDQKKVDSLSGAVMVTPVSQPAPLTDREIALKDRQSAIDSYLNKDTGYEAINTKLIGETGLNESKSKLNALNVRDIALQKRQMDMENDILNKNAQGLFGGGAQQLINQNQRDISSERANLAIEKLAIQGDISTAQALIKQKLDAQFEPVKNRIAYLEKTLDIYDKDLSESQKELLSMEKYKLQEQAKDKDTFQKIVDEAGTNGAPVNVQNEASNLFARGDRAGAISLLAQYSKRAQAESLTPYQKFQATQAIAKDTETRTAKAQEIVRQAGIMNGALSGVDTAKDLNIITQAVVATFNKILDPTSTVREGEYDRTAQGQSLLSSIQGKFENLTKGGGGITADTLKEAGDLANKYLEGAKKSIQTQNERAQSLAEQFGLNSDLVTSTGYEGGSEIRTDSEGVKYKRVPGGWQQVLGNVGSDTNKASKEIVGGYDITSYATNPAHGKNVQAIFSKVPNVMTDADIDNYIKKVAPNSPVTGIDIVNASNKYGVDPRMIIAIMQEDSTLGTKGKAVRTRNPGNVGNDDSGALRTYGSWSEGVDAVAKNLMKRKIS